MEIYCANISNVKIGVLWIQKFTSCVKCEKLCKETVTENNNYSQQHKLENC